MRSLLLLFSLVTLGCGGSAATGPDASPDAIGTDASPDAPGPDAAPDTSSDAPASCNPGAVAFPQGGTLAPGTLCDELYACAGDAAGAARIEAASLRFSCAPGSEPGSACSAYTCAFRDPGGPSTLDASEIADICAVTVLTPTPALRCVVFVNAR
jgi:hypothetical protein